MPDNYRLCRADALPGQAAKGFVLDTRNGLVPLIAVRRNTTVYGYLNRCPHTGVNLDWAADRFLDSTGTLLQCATHGALFRIPDGYCVYGPCLHQSLQAVPVMENGGFLEVSL